MIRLWNRVGIHRTLAVLLLVGAVSGGVAVAADKPTQQPDTATAANTDPIDRADLDRQDEERAEADRAARDAAQRKADEAAVAAAEQVKKSPSPSASPSKSTGKPGQAVGPVPEGCDDFTGNREVGCTLMVKAGFGLDQWSCLDKLWKKESGWNHTAENPDSKAYGIPQALPGSKMAEIAGDWRTNPATQIRWGLNYIKDRYTTPCGAWGHSQSVGWY